MTQTTLSAEQIAEKPKHGEIRFEQVNDFKSDCVKIKATLYFDPRLVVLARKEPT